MTSHTSAQALQNVLAALPARLQRRDITARKAARVALDELTAGHSEQQALAAVRHFLEALGDTPAAPAPFLPRSAQNVPKALL